MTLVAVTGAAGFIGKATTRALLNAGHEVRALVRDEPERGVFPPACKVVALGDLRSTNHLEAALSGAAAVIHLAARVPPTPRAGSAATEASSIDENVRTTERVFRAAARAAVGRFVYVSSVKAVGEVSGNAVWTETTPPRPTHAYGVSKLLSEQIVTRLAAETATEAVIIRPPVVYGPGVRGHFSALLQLARIACWIPLPLGGISNRRSTLFVHSFANALVLLAHHPAAANKIFFISDGVARSTPEIIRVMGSAIGTRPKLFAVSPALVSGLGRLVGASGAIDKVFGSLEVDDSSLRTLLGWHPPFSFEEAIAHTAGRRLPLVW